MNETRFKTLSASNTTWSGMLRQSWHNFTSSRFFNCRKPSVVTCRPTLDEMNDVELVCIVVKSIQPPSLQSVYPQNQEIGVTKDMTAIFVNLRKDVDRNSLVKEHQHGSYYFD